jgi:hypothetical protein
VRWPWLGGMGVNASAALSLLSVYMYRGIVGAACAETKKKDDPSMRETEMKPSEFRVIRPDRRVTERPTAEWPTALYRVSACIFIPCPLPP